MNAFTNTPVLALDSMLVVFVVGEREAAIELAKRTGYTIIDERGEEGRPNRIQFHRVHNKASGVEPFQITPGLFAYRITLAKNRAAPKSSRTRNRPSKKRLAARMEMA